MDSQRLEQWRRATNWLLGVNKAFAMAFCFRETPDKIILFFTEAMIITAGEIQDGDCGLLAICKRAACTTSRITVDFQSVEYISSKMIADLLLLNDLAKENSIELRLSNLAGSALEVFEMTGLNQLFGFDDDGPGLSGAGLPSPKPPSSLKGPASPKSD